MKSCFFIGHREASEEIFPELAEAVERHIVDYGVTEFIIGNYGGFDRMAARAVISAKALYPGITLLLLLSYHPAERPVKTPPDFDGTFYPPGMESAPRRYAIARANRYMVLCKASHNTIYEKQFLHARNIQNMIFVRLVLFVNVLLFPFALIVSLIDLTAHFVDFTI